MSTLRQDPTTRQWVILAPRRSDRPHDPLTLPRPRPSEWDEVCPFCPGNEDLTPPEILREPPGDGWRVRVFPNMYAALTGDGPAPRSGAPMFREMPGVGSHEVVAESPRHDARLDEMSAEEVVGVIGVWRSRYRSLITVPETRAVVVFKNFGPLAGTSLVHPHSQVVATPVFLPRLLRRMDVATHYYDENGTSVYQDLVEAERMDGTRVIAERGRFVSFVPFASASPFETWIVPTIHEASLGDLVDKDVPDLAELMRSVLGALRRACGDPDFNLVVYSAPRNGHADEVFRWHIKVIPKLTTPAGFEMGSAMSINTVPPEESAASLRATLERE